jgi:hypothetical protein
MPPEQLTMVWDEGSCSWEESVGLGGGGSPPAAGRQKEALSFIRICIVVLLKRLEHMLLLIFLLPDKRSCRRPAA